MSNKENEMEGGSEKNEQGVVLRFDNLAIDQRTLWWNPKKDITSFELARCMNLFVAGTVNMRQQLLVLFDGLPENCKRHWRVTGGGRGLTLPEQQERRNDTD